MDSPRVRVTCDRELPNVGPGNWTPVLWRRTAYILASTPVVVIKNEKVWEHIYEVYTQISHHVGVCPYINSSRVPPCLWGFSFKKSLTQQPLHRNLLAGVLNVVLVGHQLLWVADETLSVYQRPRVLWVFCSFGKNNLLTGKPLWAWLAGPGHFLGV